MAAGSADAPEKLYSFEPSLWGDFFVGYEPEPLQRSEEWMRARVTKLKDDVIILFMTCENMVEKVFLVDVVQRLGIGHHFEEQINTSLREIIENEFNSSILHEVALRFRLLREHGYWVSPDVFNQFKNEDGSFIEDLTNEPRGLLSLYNAGHLFVHGELMLDEAITFARYHLESMKVSLKSPLAQQVERSLRLPLPRTFQRVEAVNYITEYREEEGYNMVLLELAKLDFNLTRHVQLKELKVFTVWSKEYTKWVELSYVRDRAVENYTWAYVMYYEERYEFERSILAKMCLLLTTMDDTYDTHATIQECRSLHEAIQRWDENATSLVPAYLKKFYTELLRYLKEIEGEMTINVNYDISYLKNQIQKQFTYYLEEAEWSHKNHKPSFKERLNLSCLTIGVPVLCVAMMVGMDDTIMKRAHEWAAGLPHAVTACGKIARYMNDIAQYKRGKCKFDVANSIECYMNEHGVTREDAFARVEHAIEDEWKTLNQARFVNRALLPAVQRVINLTLSVPLYYGGGNDGYTFSKHLKKAISSFFVEPIPI